MLKRKLKASVDHILAGKRQTNAVQLDPIFHEGQQRPSSVPEALAFVKSVVEWRKFCGMT